MIKIQQLAAATVRRVLTGASLTVVLQDIWRNHSDLSDQQRGAIQDLSYGVLRFYGQLDALLGWLLNKPLRNPALPSFWWVVYINWSTARPPPMRLWIAQYPLLETS